MIRHWLLKPHPAVSATVCVCILLFAPSSDLPDDTPGWINDKVAHGIVFSGLSFLWMQYLRKRNRVLLLLTVFAFLTEIVQYLLPGSFQRSFDLKDIAADIAGMVAGLVLSGFFDLVWPQVKKP
ncbi:MAG: VanZ family protein [Leadbetterella sp.]|nr:VanZ family protein [Leadbetterella sp.]